jgi:hypothetical protein
VICTAIVVFIQSRHYSLALLRRRIKRRRIAVAVAVTSSLVLLRRRINVVVSIVDVAVMAWV